MTLVSVMSPQIAPGRDKTMMESEIPVPSGSWVFVYVMSVEPHDARVSAPYMGFTDMGNVPHDGLNARVFHATAIRSEAYLSVSVSVDHDDPWGIGVYVGQPDEFGDFARRLQKGS